MMSLPQAMHDAVSIFERVTMQYLPRFIFAAYSGGKDSAVVLDLMARLRHKRYCGAMSIDTSLYADGWKELVSSHAAALNTPLEFAAADNAAQWYEDDVMRHGFGYTPQSHTIYYRMLKQRAIEAHMRLHRGGRIVYVTGVRRAESPKRAVSPESYKHGRRITCNPLLNWTDEHVSLYLEKFCHWWANPYYETIGSSGDCLCGWTCRNTAPRITGWYPLIGNRLMSLSERQLALGRWPYGKRGDDFIASLNADDMPPDSMCVNCSIERS